MLDILLHLPLHAAATLLYAVLGLYFFYTRWYQNTAQDATHNASHTPSTAVSTRTTRTTHTMRNWERASIALALAVHGVALYTGLFGANSLHFSFSYAISSMLWLAALFYWLESFRLRMDGLQAVILPLAAISSALPLYFPHLRQIEHADTWGFKVHFLVAMLAYGLFTLAALHAVFMSIIERRLHRGVLSQRLASLPPILAMEASLFRIIWLAFSLLTLTLASGFFFSEQLFSRAATFDHKTVFALAAWLVFAALLLGRHAYGWRGRTALRWTLSGFFILLIAYVGSRFVFEVLLGRL
ncbi:MAG: cytochrome c biogenesis protein CcsA [Pseudomonadota bacterium]